MMKLPKRWVVFWLFVVALSCAAVASSETTRAAAQRDVVHAEVDALTEELFAAMGRQIEIDSISYGGALADASAWPFPVRNNAGTGGDGTAAGNRNERDRKVKMFREAVATARAMGFPVVVQRQDDKIVYAEFGDPDAPEMVMALSHLDSPTQSIISPNAEHWVDSSGNPNPEAYHMYYTGTAGGEEWMYGAGIQDDSGPTVATLFAAKALMEAGLPIDRRIRITMGGYEDSSPTRPTAAATRGFVEIPYYPEGNPGFFDNWAYKYLFREEMPIACFTSDSRFPVIVGNSGSGNRLLTLDLSLDGNKKWSLVEGSLGITERQGDPTLKWIGDGSGLQLPSKAVFALAKNGATAEETASFTASLRAAMTSEMAGKVTIEEAAVSGVDCLVMTINTDVAMEAPTPQYGKNALVWGMYLLAKALPEGDSYAASLRSGAEGIASLFMKGGQEDYIGTYMGLGGRVAANGCPLMTISAGYGVGKSAASYSANQYFFDVAGGKISFELYVRHMYDGEPAYNASQSQLTKVWSEAGFTISDAPAFASPTLYLTHENPLTALQFASYKNTIAANGFDDLRALLSVSYPQGTTGGTLASDYFNKMNAYGAVLPGNERWWHAANERMTKKAAVQMTKAFADCLLEMARYSGPGGAQFLSADLPGLNSDRADLDLLDVTIGTYRDAAEAVPASGIGDEERLIKAAAFDIEMFARPFERGRTPAAIAAGHGEGGIYVQLNDADYTSKTFVAPMRFEFKLTRSDLAVSGATWNSLLAMDIEALLAALRFSFWHEGRRIDLASLVSSSPEKYFSKRVSQYDSDSLYVSVNIAVVDKSGADVSISSPVASRHDRYQPAKPDVANPWPERLATVERGFFLFEDGAKDGKFSSPQAIYVTTNLKAGSSGGGGGGCTVAGSAALVFCSLLYVLYRGKRGMRP